MAQKTVGFVELEWVCPNCGSRNKGTAKICAGCGAAQPPNVEFVQPAQEELVDADKAPAPKGPDIHCPFCGVRNPGDAKVCLNCGGDLASGQKREAGRVLGAHRDQSAPPITCSSCGENNPAGNLHCTRCGAPLPGAVPQPTAAPTARRTIPLGAIIAIAAAIILVIVLFSLLFSNRDLTATVVNRNWERTIEIEQFGPVSQEDWKDEIPQEASNIRCTDKYRRTVNQPAPRSTEVCGTPYTIDQGDGSGKVVQDCEYQVYDAYCEYTIDAWAPVRLEKLEGGDEPPAWPEPFMNANQRAGDRNEWYTIVFSLDGSEKRYNTSDESAFLSAVPGSLWTLKVNGLGEIVSASPAE